MVSEADRKCPVSITLTSRIIERIALHADNRSQFILEAIEEKLARLENDEHG